MYTYPILPRQSSLSLLTLFIFTLTIFYTHALNEGAHYTDTWAVEFNADLSEKEVNEVAHQFGFENKRKVLV